MKDLRDKKLRTERKLPFWGGGTHTSALKCNLEPCAHMENTRLGVSRIYEHPPYCSVGVKENLPNTNPRPDWDRDRERPPYCRR